MKYIFLAIYGTGAMNAAKSHCAQIQPARISIRGISKTEQEYLLYKHISC